MGFGDGGGGDRSAPNTFLGVTSLHSWGSLSPLYSGCPVHSWRRPLLLSWRGGGVALSILGGVARPILGGLRGEAGWRGRSQHSCGDPTMLRDVFLLEGVIILRMFWDAVDV